MKKCILDICLFEVLQIKMEFLEGNEPIVQLIKNKMINKGNKYPKSGPLMVSQEMTRYHKLLRDYQVERMDALYTNEILGGMDE